MTYRETAQAVRTGRVQWGPFPIRWGYLAATPACVFFAALMALLALERDHLACDAGGACVLQRTVHDDVPFRREDVAGPRVTIETGSKGAKYGVVNVDWRSGSAPLRLMRQSTDGAELTAAELRRKLATPGPFEVEVHGPTWVVGISGLLVLGAIWLFVAGLRGIGRFTVDVVQRGTALEVRRRVFGLPLGGEVVPLAGVVDVVVERGVIPTFWRARGQPNPPGGRVVLVTRGEGPRPLASGLFPGSTTHLRAAVELRRLLDLPPTRGGVEEELAAVQPVRTPPASRFVFAWAGMFGGGVAGVLVGTVPVIALRKAGAGEQVVGATLLGCAIVGAVTAVTIAIRATRPRMPR